MTCHLIPSAISVHSLAPMLAYGAHSIHVGFVRLSVVYVSLLCVDLT